MQTIKKRKYDCLTGVELATQPNCKMCRALDKNKAECVLGFTIFKKHKAGTSLPEYIPLEPCTRPTTYSQFYAMKQAIGEGR